MTQPLSLKNEKNLAAIEVYITDISELHFHKLDCPALAMSLNRLNVLLNMVQGRSLEMLATMKENNDG